MNNMITEELLVAYWFQKNGSVLERSIRSWYIILSAIWIARTDWKREYLFDMYVSDENIENIAIYCEKDLINLLLILSR
jgi:hypothetical protein